MFDIDIFIKKLNERLDDDIVDKIRNLLMYVPCVTRYSISIVREILIKKKIGYGIFSRFQYDISDIDIYYINIKNRLPISITEYIPITNTSTVKNILKEVKKKYPDSFIISMVSNLYNISKRK